MKTISLFYVYILLFEGVCICSTTYWGIGPFYWHWITLIPAWISHYIHRNHEFTHPFLNFYGGIWEWISNLISHFTRHVIIQLVYSCHAVWYPQCKDGDDYVWVLYMHHTLGYQCTMWSCYSTVQYNTALLTTHQGLKQAVVQNLTFHYSDIIMSVMASQITSLMIV